MKKKSVKKYALQDFLDDLSLGKKYGVFIDDTGSPGQKTPNLHPERKSWVAVIVSPDQMPEVLKEFPGAIQELYNVIGAKEFHFSDLYSGKGEFKGVNLQARLGIIEFMAYLFNRYRFPLLVQTLDPNLLENVRKRAEGQLPKKSGPFNLTKQEDTALIFLLIRVKNYLNEKPGSCTARIFVDEGYKRNGISICISDWKSVFADGLICFARSSSLLPLQLADFAAWSLNRQQILMNKKNLTPLDKSLLRILSSVSWNYVNIPVVELKID